MSSSGADRFSDGDDYESNDTDSSTNNTVLAATPEERALLTYCCIGRKHRNGP